jgi:hypothetical protein
MVNFGISVTWGDHHGGKVQQEYGVPAPEFYFGKGVARGGAGNNRACQIDKGYFKGIKIGHVEMVITTGKAVYIPNLQIIAGVKVPGYLFDGEFHYVNAPFHRCGNHPQKRHYHGKGKGPYKDRNKNIARPDFFHSQYPTRFFGFSTE